MKRLSILFVSSLIFLVGSSTVFASCEGLKNKAPKGVDIKAAMYFADNNVRVPYCLVRGEMARRMGVDNNFYGIKFELRLPNRWKGRFAYQFNGGNDGEVKPALGASAGLLPSEYAINQGFAVVSSNGGHESEANPQAGLAGNAVFAHDPEARRNYGYAAVEQLNPVARSLVESYYQSPIKYSYGIGSSNGGRMAMVAASRFPTMFDGLLVGYPGFNLPKAALQHAWDIQALHRVNSNVNESLSKRDLAFFAKNILTQCDGLDGVNDDLIFAIEACQNVFQPKALACTDNFDRDCLSVNKVAALIRMHQGPHNSKNQALYSGWFFDSGIQSKNWRMWKIESAISNWSNKPISGVMGAASLAHIFTTPYTNVPGNPFALERYLLNFDFDKDAPKIYAKNSRFKESAMELMAPPDVDSPKLTDFRKNGGKMMVFHGNSDPVFSVKNTIRWYNYLNFNLEGRANRSVRLYLVPGMPHGQGGASMDQFNMLKPLMSWVENNEAPQDVVAHARSSNSEITARMAGISRPLCAYPTYAHYVKGDILKARSFECR
ncbi:tannase/feruloyl esterase family alpha/beta hydrolase [Marinomonas transparens]|uniref:Tannase/feruloyl esterase family alpha/beta hydrolase n=1 Tax=Marinomonas transparens TaxID=2795388 RepID=A0A934JSK2_9GAMM|nr:tannase/feruloyl esterase family alpha/beta hydrolase [Marinomonas transparens]MBJ7536307.1 tannase/feruloyl esterase family alpha/beta hydrolase [Marinomonas transparens]